MITLNLHLVSYTSRTFLLLSKDLKVILKSRKRLLQVTPERKNFAIMAVPPGDA